MTQTFATNLTHLFNEQGVSPACLPKQAIKLAENLGQLVSNATTHSTLTPRSNVRCWGGIHKNRCQGYIDASIDSEQSSIVWQCPACGDNGTITHWKNSFWDLGAR
ncbi:MAG: hypothetical protein K0U24_07185 [Gammaproteobacteria bacterium]|nr:hypothetical protein [Gammaproteobacteria bacterium]MCH9763985.1 hypothetical protein [Gammaproteobacteria bacterium]